MLNFVARLICHLKEHSGIDILAKNKSGLVLVYGVWL